MDLLFISAYPLYPAHASTRMLAYHLGRELTARRHIVDLLAFSNQPEDIAELPRYRDEFRHVELIPAPVRPLRKRLRQSPDLLPPNEDALWSLQMWEAIQQAISERHYDLVHLIGGVEVYEYAPLLRDFPTVISPIQGQSQIMQRQYQQTRNWLHRLRLRTQYRLLNRYERQVYHHFDAVTVISQQDSQGLKALDPQANITVIPTGIDMEYLMPTGCDPRLPSLFFTGDFTKPADLEAAHYLAESIYPAVKKEIPDLHLFLIGEAPPDSLRALAGKTVHVPGSVLDTRPYFELASVYVAPYRHAVGVELSLLQALAMMTPVVTTPLGAAGLDLVPGEEITTGQTTAEVVQAILALLRHPIHRLRMQLAGWEKLHQQYGWEAIALQYESLYKKCISSR